MHDSDGILIEEPETDFARNSQILQRNKEPRRHETIINKFNYYHEYCLFSHKTQTTDRSSSSALQNNQTNDRTQSDEQLLDSVRKVLESVRKHDQGVGERLLIFLMFFVVHGTIALISNTLQLNHSYTYFIVTQFCGFVTFMFWNTTYRWITG